MTDRQTDGQTDRKATAIARSDALTVRCALKTMCETSVEFVKQTSFESGVDDWTSYLELMDGGGCDNENDRKLVCIKGDECEGD